MKHKVEELEGALLDAAVALAEGWLSGSYSLDGFRPDGQGWLSPSTLALGGDETIEGGLWEMEPFAWSTDWQRGGPIIQRERLTITFNGEIWEAGPMNSLEASGAAVSFCGNGQSGPTPLIAAMRAYVASKLGDEVELP